MARLLVVTNDFPPGHGGIETYVHELVRRFDADDVVVATSRREGWQEWDAAQPYPVERISRYPMLPTRTVAREVVRIANEHKCEAAWFGAAAPLGLLAADLRTKTQVRKVVSTTHGHEVWWAAVPGFRHALRTIARRADRVTYISDYTRKHLVRELPVERLERLSPGVTPQTFADVSDEAVADLRRRWVLGDAPVVVSISRLVARKGHDTLIAAWPRVLEHHPDARLVIGGRGPYAGHLSELVAKHKVSDAVTFAGFVPDDDLAALYRTAQVFAMPARSRWGGLEVEGLGIVYLEAAAAGLPVVTGTSGGAPEAVRDSETGCVVDGTDATAVAWQIVELLNDPARAAAMGEAGRAWMVDQWTWDARHRTLATLLGLLH
ncbi:MAG: glycosyltransferase family 4 protein [Micrococcales bacterium]|nr:glycosyltransferase family 4 protein [Micrococcales bacterium]